MPSGRPQNYTTWTDVTNFYGFDVPMLTFWVPLSPVGKTAPGLDFLRIDPPPTHAALKQLWQRVHAKATELRAAASLETDELGAVFPGTLSIDTKAMDPGDFAVFDQYVPHRTQALEKSVDYRIAVEFRVIPRAPLPDPKILAATGHFLASWRDDNGTISVGPLLNVPGLAAAR
jgi:hypothetical protein